MQNLWDKFIVHYGLLERILTDQGHNFESDLLKALCDIAQVKKIWTLGHYPQTNGQCEHFNATLINMLGTLPEKPKSIGRQQVPTLVHAYNCTIYTIYEVVEQTFKIMPVFKIKSWGVTTE